LIWRALAARKPAFSLAPHLAGRSLEDVANDLRSKVLSPDQLPIQAFDDDNGQQ
jgi:hypothetical protein